MMRVLKSDLFAGHLLNTLVTRILPYRHFIVFLHLFGSRNVDKTIFWYSYAIFTVFFVNSDCCSSAVYAIDQSSVVENSLTKY